MLNTRGCCGLYIFLKGVTALSSFRMDVVAEVCDGGSCVLGVNLTLCLWHSAISVNGNGGNWITVGNAKQT